LGYPIKIYQNVGFGKTLLKENFMDEGGIIFLIIVGVVVVFFVCRELMCWYYKINRIVSLLENQNFLLKMQITFVPTHTVKLLDGEDKLWLREKPSSDAGAIEDLPPGAKVQFISKKPEEVEINGIKGTWFKILTHEKTDGWCFSGNLEKM
jgi:hypothetical protein